MIVFGVQILGEVRIYKVRILGDNVSAQSFVRNFSRNASDCSCVQSEFIANKEQRP